jgi:hypothetical protein
MNQTFDTAKPSRLESLLAKRERIERQLKAMAARQNTARRKAEAHAKFILGGLVLKRAVSDRAVFESFCAELPAKEQALVRAAAARLAEIAGA